MCNPLHSQTLSGAPIAQSNLLNESGGGLCCLVQRTRMRLEDRWSVKNVTSQNAACPRSPAFSGCKEGPHNIVDRGGDYASCCENEFRRCLGSIRPRLRLSWPRPTAPVCVGAEVALRNRWQQLYEFFNIQATEMTSEIRSRLLVFPATTLRSWEHRIEVSGQLDSMSY